MNIRRTAIAFSLVVIFFVNLEVFARNRTHPRLSISASKCDPQSYRAFVWGLGSERVKVIGMRNTKCVIEIYSEMEGGYSILECKIEPTMGDFVVEEQCNPDKGDFGMRCGIHYSFDISKCTVIKHGNIFWDRDKLVPPVRK